MKAIVLLAACAALTGCAGTETAVRASAARDFDTGVRTYGFASDRATERDEESARCALALERRLEQLGFAKEPAATARYRVALSRETRPVSVGIGYGRCADGMACGAASLPRGFEWPGAKYYIHSLTLRFFDTADGREAYKVSATKRDRDADARRDIEELVASALARLPFASADAGRQASDWEVTLRPVENDATPSVIRIAPLAR